MQPSSLVFLVIIAIWAAYLLQHWVRRREHLAMARSVDRFSDAMRVLERHTPLPEFAARPPRPEVVVKRAKAPIPNVPTRPAAAVRPTRTFNVLAGVSARRVRGLSLLASLSLALVGSPLAAFSVLPWWSVLVAVAVLVADGVWLRHVAVSERATGRAKALAHRSAAAPARSATRYSAAPELEPEPEVEPEPEPEVEVAPLVAGADEVAEPAATVAEPNAEAVPSGWADPSGWAPVPVPPPTYTLKARAERPVHIPEFVELTEYAPVLPLSPDDLIDEGELDGLPERRSAAGA